MLLCCFLAVFFLNNILFFSVTPWSFGALINSKIAERDVIADSLNK